MSFRIHNCFILPGATLEEAMPLIQQLRRDIATRAKIDCATLVARKAATRIDKHAARQLFPSGKEPSVPPGPDLHFDILQELFDRARKIKPTMSRDPEADFEMRLCLYPDGPDILGSTICERQEWHEHWLATPGVEEYRYWDNSDPPEDIDPDAWQTRGARWERVFALEPRIGYAGLIAEIHDIEPDLVSYDLMDAYEPSRAARINSVAMDVMRSRAVHALMERDGSNLPLSSVSRAIFGVQDHLETEAGKTELANLSDQIDSLLPSSTRAVRPRRDT